MGSSAEAAANNTINFQARVLTSAGAVVPDGNYSVQFKMYDVVSGGSALWTETHSPVVVKSGYVSVPLGSITAFPGTINWDQELWLTMNINSDGEMNPRMKVTSVPFAQAAAKLQQTSGGLTSTLSLLAPTGGNQVFQIANQGTNGIFTLCIENSSACGFAPSSGSSSYIQNQNALQQAASNFWISGIGRADTAIQSPLINGSSIANGTLALQGNSASSGNTLTNANIQFNVGDNGGTTAMTILNNGRIGIGTVAPSAPLNINSGTVSSAAVIEGNDSSGNGIFLTVRNNNTGNSSYSGYRMEPGGTFFGARAALNGWGIANGISFRADAGRDVAFTAEPTITGSLAGPSMILKSGGNLGIGLGSASPTAQLQVHSRDPGTVTQIIRGAASQNANLTQWQSSDGSVLARINNSGQFSGNIQGTTFLFSGGTDVLMISPSGSGTLFQNRLPGASVTFQPFDASGVPIIVKGLDSQTGDLFRVQNSANSVLFEVTASGNVGVGTTTPLAPLHINSSGTTNETLPGFVFSMPSTTNKSRLQNYVGGLSYLSQNYYRDASSGGWLKDNASNGIASIILNTSVSAQGLYFITGTNVASAESLTRMYIDTNGRVGIGSGVAALTSLFSVGSTSQFQVNSSGVIAAATGITSSGTITLSGLTADRLVATTTGGQLTNTITSSNLLASVSGTTGTGNLVFSDSPTFSGTLTASAANFSGNISQSGATTFSSGTGAVSLNGNTSITGSNTLTVGTGATSLGGSLTVSGASTFNNDVTVVGDIASAGTKWTSRNSAANNQWRSVTYGNGLFVAVANSGTGNRVMTSPDGINWTARNVPVDNPWSSVTYGNGLFVAVSESGSLSNQVMTSPDGITWTSRTSAVVNQWRSVTYGNGLFVAVSNSGTGNRVMTSSNGILWVARSSATDNEWSSVTYGNGLFVAVATTGTGNRVMTSPDGVTWASRTSAANNEWRSVTYGNGLFVAVATTGTGNRVMTSPDGITWTTRSSANDNNWLAVTYGNGLFVAVANSGSGNRVMTSPDGVTWTSRTSAADNEWWGIGYGNGLFVATSTTGTGNRVMTSGKNTLIATQSNNIYQGGLKLYGSSQIASDEANALLVQNLGDGININTAVNIFSVNGQSKMVGIGTSTPSAQLEIIPTLSSYVGQIIRGASGQTGDLMQIVNGDNKLFIVKSSGNIGIGTDNPSENLQIVSSSPTLKLQHNAGTSSNNSGTLLLQQQNNTGVQIRYEGDTDVFAIRTLGDGSQNGGVFAITNVDANNVGRVGIGTTSPSALLSVGSTSQFQVNSSGAIAAVTGITSSGAYNQSGTSANTFTGATTFSATGTALSVTNNATVGGSLSLGSDVSLSRGAANRLDLATGDSFNLVSGNLQVGATTVISSARAIQNATGITSSGTITLSGLTADRLVATTTGGQLTNTITSSNLLASVSGTTGTGNLVFATSPTFATSITSPIVYGSSAANGTLVLQGNSATTGNTATNSNIQFNVGNNGATTAMTILNNGNVGINKLAPTASLHVLGSPIPGGVFQGNTPGILKVAGPVYASGDVLSIDFSTDSHGSGAWPLARIAAEITASGSVLRFGTSNLYANGITNTAMSINSLGRVGIGTTTPTAQLQVQSSTSTTVAQSIRGAVLQTADLTQWQDSAGTTTLAQVLASGQMRYLYGGPLGTALQNVATETYVQSRGQNLISNGFGYLRNNTGFSSFSYDAANQAIGLGGFSYDGADSARGLDETYAVDLGEVYNFSYYIKLLSKSVPAEVPRFYSGISSADADGLAVASNHVYKTPGSAFTSLAADLNNGDTTITLNNATGWNNSAAANQKRIGFYPYTNSQGFTYPDYTYTRDVTAGGLWNAGGISGNVITLAAPWSGGFKPAGTKVANHIDAGTYEYMTVNVNTPAEHTKYNDYVGKVEGDWSTTAFAEGSLAPIGNGQTSPNSKFRWGTARINLLYLLSYNTPVGTAKTIVSGLSFGLAEDAKQRLIVGNVSQSNSNANLQVTSTSVSSIAQIIKGSSGQTADLLQVRNDSNATLFNVAANGNVGVGTSAPSTEFEVVGDITSTGTKWTSRSSAANNEWLSVTYGNGIFVAVAKSGSGNRVMTSPDGINWTARSAAVDNEWLSVTFGNGLFVAVAQTGTGNRVMISSNGIDWTVMPSPSDINWRSVTYGNGRFVAVASNSSGVMTSEDGKKWTPRTAANANSWVSVTYGNGLFVAVAYTGSGNRVMTSPDGITWTARTSAADNSWWSVTYGNGLFVAVANSGSGNRVMTSPDGITWTSRTSAANNNWNSVVYGEGIFVAVAESGSGNRVMTSPDGINWTLRNSTADNSWHGITYANGMFVAVGYSGSGNRVMTSGKANLMSNNNDNILLGNVGIGNNTPNFLLHVGSADIGTGGSVAQFQNAGGTCTITPSTAGGITCTSDIRNKKNINDYDSKTALGQVLGLNTISYNINTDPDGYMKKVGFSAQDLEAILPDLVVTASDGYKSISYSGLTPYLVSAIQEQQSQIDDAKSRLSELENTVQPATSILDLTNGGSIQGTLNVVGNLNVTGSVAFIDLTVTSNVSIGGNLVVKDISASNITINGKIITAGDKPTITLGQKVGVADSESNIPEPSARVEGNDTSGTITIIPGKDPEAGEIVKIDFAADFSAKPRIVISPGNRDSAKAGFYHDVSQVANSGFSVFVDQALETGKTYSFTYFIVQ